MKIRNVGALDCPLSRMAREDGRRDLRSSSLRKACRTGESRPHIARAVVECHALRKKMERIGDSVAIQPPSGEDALRLSSVRHAGRKSESDQRAGSLLSPAREGKVEE
jgi:hypothetical protein